MIAEIFYDRNKIKWEDEMILHSIANLHKNEEAETFVNSLNSELKNKKWFKQAVFNKKKKIVEIEFH